MFILNNTLNEFISYNFLEEVDLMLVKKDLLVPFLNICMWYV